MTRLGPQSIDFDCPWIFQIAAGFDVEATRELQPLGAVGQEAGKTRERLK